MSDWVAEIAGDSNDKYRRAALVLRTLAWTSICWAAALSIWIWAGARAGSNLWLWSVLGFFVGGVILLGIAARLQLKASHFVETPGKPDDDRIRAA